MPALVQPWYTNDVAMAGPVPDVAKAMWLLLTQFPARGYYPEQDKSIFTSCLDPSTSPGLDKLLEFNF